MWLHLGKVDLYNLVVESRRISHHLIIGAEFCRILLGGNSNLLPARLFSGVKIPAAIEEIKTAPIRHSTVAEIGEMKEVIRKMLGI